MNSIHLGGVAYSKNIPGMIIAVVSCFEDDGHTIHDTIHFYGTKKNFEKSKKSWEKSGFWKVKYAFTIKDRVYP
jgi:hypothetical protein